MEFILNITGSCRQNGAEANLFVLNDTDSLIDAHSGAGEDLIGSERDCQVYRVACAQVGFIATASEVRPHTVLFTFEYRFGASGYTTEVRHLNLDHIDGLGLREEADVFDGVAPSAGNRYELHLFDFHLRQLLLRFEPEQTFGVFVIDIFGYVFRQIEWLEKFVEIAVVVIAPEENSLMILQQEFLSDLGVSP